MADKVDGHSQKTLRLVAEPRPAPVSREDAQAFIADLNTKRSAEIYGFLDRPPAGFSSMSVPEVAAAKNQVMDYMLLQKPISPDFGFKLVELVRNVSNDTLLRIFAVQHLDLYSGTMWNRRLYDSAGDEAAHIRNALTEAALNSQSPIGGTAMLALEKMSHFDAGIDGRELAAQRTGSRASPRLPQPSTTPTAPGTASSPPSPTASASSPSTSTT